MGIFSKKRLFLDYAGGAENPSAIHAEGREAKKRLEEARDKIARILQVQSRDVIFTSGGTEADNTAMLGVYKAALKEIEHPHIVVSSREHPAVLECAREIERQGGEVTYIPAEGGRVLLEDVRTALKENTVLVSIMLANNETGALNPIGKISRLIAEARKNSRSRYPYLHTDASQAASTISMNLGSIGADMVTLESGKIGGPKGVGLLAMRSGLLVNPIMFGGGQERGLRPGTEHVEAIEKFAKALEFAQSRREEESRKFSLLKKTFIEEVTNITGIVINTPEDSLPNIVSLSCPGELHEFLAIKLDLAGVAVSTGSSCDSSKNEDEKEALRFSFGPNTTEKEVGISAKILKKIVEK